VAAASFGVLKGTAEAAATTAEAAAPAVASNSMASAAGVYVSRQPLQIAEIWI